jgi:phage terminase small subunit
MTLPKRLTEMQQKFAELLVYNEGRKTPTECAIEAGYDKDSAHVRASELRNPNKYPGVVRYIGELREELQKKYEITFEKHVAELAKLRDSSRDKGAWSAAINAEVARGKAAGLYVEQKIIRTGKLEDMTEKELELKMKQLIEDHKGLIVEADFNLVNDKQIEEIKEEEPKQSDSI